MNWDIFTKILKVVGVVVGFTVAAMLYFVPAKAFEEFKDQYNFDRAMQTKRDLRQEAAECRKIIREYHRLTPKEEKDCDEVAEELEDIKNLINSRWGTSKVPVN